MLIVADYRDLQTLSFYNLKLPLGSCKAFFSTSNRQCSYLKLVVESASLQASLPANPSVRKQANLTAKPLITSVRNRANLPANPLITSVRKQANLPANPFFTSVRNRANLQANPLITSVRNRAKLQANPLITSVRNVIFALLKY
jgi:hypothetical protein